MVNLVFYCGTFHVHVGKYYTTGWNNLITVCSPTGKSSHNILFVFILSLDKQFMKLIKLNQIFLEGRSLANCLWHHLLHRERKYGVLIGMLWNSQGTELWWFWSQWISVRSQILTGAREYTVSALQVCRELLSWSLTCLSLPLWSSRQKNKSRFLWVVIYISNFKLNKYTFTETISKEYRIAYWSIFWFFADSHYEKLFVLVFAFNFEDFHKSPVTFVLCSSLGMLLNIVWELCVGKQVLLTNEFNHRVIAYDKLEFSLWQPPVSISGECFPPKVIWALA